MARRVEKKHIDTELLDAIYALEKDWKQIQEIGALSIERTEESRSIETLARARYLFLLREARHRNVSALRK